MGRGMYAPIKKPIAALIIPVNAPTALVDLKGASIKFIRIEADKVDNTVMPNTANTSNTVRYQPVAAR